MGMPPMARYSHGVMLAGGLAGAEAQSARCPVIEPAQLLLGLCKVCDLPLRDVAPGIPDEARLVLPTIEAEVAELREAFGKAGLDPTRFRRRLRAILGEG